MLRQLFLLSICFFISVVHAQSFTVDEERWLELAAPVLTYGLKAGLPVGVIVETMPENGSSPVGLAKDCKVVLNIRNNQAVRYLEEQMPVELRKPLTEAFFAHELGHCYRQLHKLTNTLPFNMVDKNDDRYSDDIAKIIKIVREGRREEGYSDLVGLAWVKLNYSPEVYTKVVAWFKNYRKMIKFPGELYDTSAWLDLAEQLKIDPNRDIFEQVMPAWKAGLLTPIM